MAKLAHLQLVESMLGPVVLDKVLIDKPENYYKFLFETYHKKLQNINEKSQENLFENLQIMADQNNRTDHLNFFRKMFEAYKVKMDEISKNGQKKDAEKDLYTIEQYFDFLTTHLGSKVRNEAKSLYVGGVKDLLFSNELGDSQNIFDVIQGDLKHSYDEDEKSFYYQLYDITCCKLIDTDQEDLNRENQNTSFKTFKEKMKYQSLHVTNFLYISCLHRKFCESILETYLLYLHYEKNNTEVTLKFSIERLKDLCSSKVKLWILGAMNDGDTKKANEEVILMKGEGAEEGTKTKTQKTIQTMIKGKDAFASEFKIKTQVTRDNGRKEGEYDVNTFLPYVGKNDDFFGNPSENEMKDLLAGIVQFIEFLDTPYTLWNIAQVPHQNLPKNENFSVEALQSEEDRLAFTASLMNREMTLWSRSKLMKITSYMYYLTQLHYMLRLYSNEYLATNTPQNIPKNLLRNLLGKNNINWFQNFYSKQIDYNNSYHQDHERDFNKECYVLQWYFSNVVCNAKTVKFEEIYNHMRSFNMEVRYVDVNQALKALRLRSTKNQFEITKPKLKDIHESLQNLLTVIKGNIKSKNMQLNQPLHQSLVTLLKYTRPTEARNLKKLLSIFTDTSKILFDFLVKINVISEVKSQSTEQKAIFLKDFRDILTFQQLRYFYIFIGISHTTLLDTPNIGVSETREHYEMLSNVYDLLIVTSKTLLSPFFNTCMSQRTARKISDSHVLTIEQEEQIYMKCILQNYYSIFEKLKMLQSTDKTTDPEYDSIHKNLPESFWWDVLKDSCSRTDLRQDRIIPNITTENFFATEYLNTTEHGMKQTLHIEFSPFHNLDLKNVLTKTKPMDLWKYADAAEGGAIVKTRSVQRDDRKYYNHFGHEIQKINLFSETLISRTEYSSDPFNTDAQIHDMDDEILNELNPKEEILYIFGLKSSVMKDHKTRLPILHYFSKTKIDEDQEMVLEDESVELLQIQGPDPYVNIPYDIFFRPDNHDFHVEKKNPQELGRYFPYVKEIKGSNSFFYKYLKEFLFKDDSFKALNDRMKKMNTYLKSNRVELSYEKGEIKGNLDIKKNAVFFKDKNKQLRCIWLDDVFLKVADELINSTRWSAKRFDCFSFSLDVAKENGTNTGEISTKEYTMDFPKSPYIDRFPKYFVDMAYKMIMNEFPLSHEGTDLFLGDDMARCKTLWSTILNCVSGQITSFSTSTHDLFCMREIASYHFGLFIMEALERNSRDHQLDESHKNEITGINLKNKDPVKYFFYDVKDSTTTNSGIILEASMKRWLDERWDHSAPHIPHHEDQTIFYATEGSEVFRFADSLLSTFTLGDHPDSNKFNYNEKKLDSSLGELSNEEKNYMIFWDYGRFICGHHSKNPLTSMFDMDNNLQWTSRFDNIFQYNMNDENMKVSRDTPLQYFSGENSDKAEKLYEQKHRKLKRDILVKKQKQDQAQATQAQATQPPQQAKIQQDDESDTENSGDSDSDEDVNVEDVENVEDDDENREYNNFMYLLKLFKRECPEWFNPIQAISAIDLDDLNPGESNYQQMEDHPREERVNDDEMEAVIGGGAPGEAAEQHLSDSSSSDGSQDSDESDIDEEEEGDP